MRGEYIWEIQGLSWARGALQLAGQVRLETEDFMIAGEMTRDSLAPSRLFTQGADCLSLPGVHQSNERLLRRVGRHLRHHAYLDPKST